ncbi:MAG: YraN family protein [Halioglobus sp.]|nr:YraN family protein [Halioglobus sp.]
MKALGDDYENRAAALIEESGLCVVERNFRGKTGEIDIVAEDSEQLVFIEVRARTNHQFESAAGSVNRRKQQRLVRTAQLFLQHRPRWAGSACRFDVIAFEPPQSGSPPQIRWIRGAFTA